MIGALVALGVACFPVKKPEGFSYAPTSRVCTSAGGSRINVGVQAVIQHNISGKDTTVTLARQALDRLLNG